MDYSLYVRKSIEYIERNLCEPLSLDVLAREAGFSKYHFLRVFERETGSGLSAYVRRRRIARAAALLLKTELPILEIALICRFESQEAFTRAFKGVYSLPPGRYRRTMRGLIDERENHRMKQKALIPGWLMSGSTPEKYEYGPDRTVFFQGTKSVFLRSREVKLDEGDFGTVMQQFRAATWVGKRVRFSVFVKAEDVTGWAGLWMRIDSSAVNMLKFDNMQNRPIQGTSDWNCYSVVLDVPENSVAINIGILLGGAGKLWFDGIRFETVDKNVPTTDLDISSELPEGPENLSLEE